MTPSEPEPPPQPPPPPPAPRAPGLCPICAYVRVLSSDRGSTFYLCQRSKDDPRYPRYPPQPVWVCAGFER